MRRSSCPLSLIVLLLTLNACPICSGQSLWERRDQQKSFLFQDLKARRVGDVLTILIRENTDVTNSDSREMSKSSANEGSANIASSGGGSSSSGSFNFGSSSRRNFEGDADFSSERQFSDRFSVTVVDVLPNGNMLISGKRGVLVEGDRKVLRLSGIVRGYDVRNDNSVLSHHVANLDISFQGEGPETVFSNQGWLSRHVNKWWPF